MQLSPVLAVGTSVGAAMTGNVGSAAEVGLGSGVGLGIGVGGTGVSVGMACCVCAIIVLAAATAEAWIWAGSIVGTAGAQAALNPSAAAVIIHRIDLIFRASSMS